MSLGNLFRRGEERKVCVYREEGVWFAEWEWLNICGSGASPSEALEDAGKHIRHFIGYYAGISEEELTGRGVELKGRFLDMKRSNG